VIRYKLNTKDAVHVDVEAADPMAAAITICGGPLAQSSMLGANLVALASPMIGPVQRWLFCRPESQT